MRRTDVSEAVGRLLAELGFHRHDSAWVRTRGLFSDLIDLQCGKPLDAVTVNVGLMHAPTYEMAWGRSPTYPPSEPDCVVRTRLGFLIDGRDRWWQLDEETAVSEITGALSSAALPFLSGFKELEDVERWLDEEQSRYPPEALYVAAVKHQRGKDQEARKMLQKLLQRTTSGSWRERISSMAASLA